MKKTLLYIFLLMHISLSCDTILEEPAIDGEPVYDNPKDPLSENYMGPNAQVIFPSDKSTINTSSLTIRWEGSSGDSPRFMYYLRYYDERIWDFVELSRGNTRAGWDLTYLTQQDYHYLDEGVYEFWIWERDVSGREQKHPSRISFTVNAVEGPALIMKNQWIRGYIWHHFEVDIIAHEVSRMAGLECEVDFSDINIELAEVRRGSSNYFQLPDANHLYNHTPVKEANEEKRIKFTIVQVGGDPDDMGGENITIATLKFNTFGSSEGMIEFVENSAKMRDENNQPIGVNQMVGSKVIIK